MRDIATGTNKDGSSGVPTSSTAPAPVQKSHKSLIIGTGAGAVVALAAAGYFLAVPIIQINQYKSAAQSKHDLVEQKMVRVYDSFKRSVFVATGVKSDAAKADLDVATEAIKDAKSSIDASAAALTSFSAWPLLDWNNAYHKATETDKNEAAYITQASELLSKYRALTDYLAEYNILTEQMEKSSEKLEGLSSTATPASLAAQIDTIVTEMQTILAKEKSMTSPDYLKDYQDKDVAAAEKMITTMKSFSAAVKALDLAKIMSLSGDLETQVKAIGAYEKQMLASLQKESAVATGIARVKETSKKITYSF